MSNSLTHELDKFMTRNILIHRGPGDNYLQETYLTITLLRTEPMLMLTSSQTSLSPLSHLRTLNLRSWPTFECSETLFDSYGGMLNVEVLPIYTHLLQRIAQYVFAHTDKHFSSSSSTPILFSNPTTRRSKPPSRLAVVAFGSNGNPFFEAGNQLYMIPFVRGTVVDAFGESGMVAVQTKCHLVKFVEPECEVLNWSWQGENEGGRIYENV